MREYVPEEICGKYEGYPLLYKQWDFEKFQDLPLNMGSRTLKNYSLWDLGKIPSISFI